MGACCQGVDEVFGEKTARHDLRKYRRRGPTRQTRVLLDASDGHETWGSIGVSENVIEASWDALVDSLEAGMLPGRKERVGGGPGLSGAAAP